MKQRLSKLISNRTIRPGDRTTATRRLGMIMPAAGDSGLREPAARWDSEHGFSALDILGSLTIFLLTVTLGIPGFLSYSATESSRSEAEFLYDSLLAAHSSAFHGTSRIYVHANGGKNSDWNNGWIITTNPALDSLDCNGRTSFPGVLSAFCREQQEATSLISDIGTIAFRPGGQARPANIVICTESAAARTVGVGATGVPYIKHDGICAPDSSH